MNGKSILTLGDYGEYLVRVYFGRDANMGYLNACIDRAYRDFNRTLRGLSKVKSKDELHAKAVSVLATALGNLRTICAQEISETKFDDWHRNTCEGLISTYKENGYARFHFGQAQKWINMSLKYIYVMGEKRVDGFGEAYQFCHAPLDNILVKELNKEHGFPELGAWSQLKDYEVYLGYQMRIRERFKREPPLDVEFRLWLGEKVPGGLRSGCSRPLTPYS